MTPVDTRADVFSLAVLTYETLTGRLPYGTGSFIDVGVRQANCVKAVPRDGFLPSLAETLQGALSPDRDHRPATAGAFAEALRAGL